MIYDLDALTDRRGTFSYKWAVKHGELPMWVADMDFECPPAVKEALVKRAEHGIFGYSETPCQFFEAVQGYWQRRHGFFFPTEWMVYSSGVVAAISSVVRKLTSPGDNVVIQAPVYNIFYNSILNNGRTVLSSDLVFDGEGYTVDFDDLEAKLSDERTTLMILCNPHNPVGKIWSREELARIGELCHRHGVTVFSDEIHCDFTRPGREYTPFASASETCADIAVTALSASKTFNIAGLQSACIAVKDPDLRFRVWRGINTDEVGEPNAFAIVGATAAFTECDEWVEQLRKYVFENRRLATEFINGSIPGLHAIAADATYLLWVDASAVCSDSVKLCARIRELTGLILSDGAEYGECSRAFLRINLATQRARVLDGLERLKRAVEIISAEHEQG